MKRKIAALLTLIMALSMIISPAFASPLDSPVESTTQPPTAAPQLQEAPLVQAADAAGPARYFVILSDPSAPNYTGGIDGLEATNPAAKGQTSFDAQSEASQAYASYLQAQQAAFLSDAAQALGRSPEVVYQLQFSLNAVVMVLDPAEAKLMTKLPGVVRVERDVAQELDTDVGPQWIGAPGIWNGTATGGLPGTKGEGVIIGVLDTGINMDHPSFADIGGDGFNHTNPFGPGNYKGWCNPGFPVQVTCNDKLVGAWDYADASWGETGGPEDTDGHGSHTASTSGGNYLAPGTVVLGSYPYSPAISGVAPHVNIIAYDVCGTSCYNTDVVAALNQVILDDVDVTNESIGIGGDTWSGAKQAAYLSVFNAGITSARSAGNSGPGASTIETTPPWVITVGANTHNRAGTNSVTNLAGGSTAPPGGGTLTGLGVSGSSAVSPIVYAGNAPYNDALCLNPFAPGSVTGKIVICDRGTNARVAKGWNVLQGGAAGMVLANTSASQSLVGDLHHLPAVHINSTDGTALKTWVNGGTGHQGSIAGTALSFAATNGDVMASFSSRGPHPAVPSFLTPDVTNPGVDILAAYRSGSITPEVPSVEYAFVSGTSMSSPHTAGSAALVKALHPTWTPAEIKSALMDTGKYTGIRKEDGVTPAIPFDMGTGRVDLNNAGNASLVLNETGANFLAANPGTGGNPKTLNLASLADPACATSCSWTRTVKATRAGNWNATYVTPAGMTLTATPSNFTLAAGQTQTLNITANVAGLPVNAYAFGYVVLTHSPTEGNAAGDVIHLTVVVQPISGAANIDVTPSSLAATQDPNTTTSQTLTIGNTGTTPLTWSIAEAPDTLRLPTGVSRGVEQASATRQVTIGDASFTRSTVTAGQVVTPERSATPDGLVTITHSASQSIVGLNSVSCNAGGLHTDNSYLRQFDLSAFGISDTFNVTTVEVGVEEAFGAGGSQPLTVNLYTKINPGGALTWANLSQIGTASTTVTDQALTVLSVPVTGAAPAGSVLVVEVFTPNGQTAGNSFFVGSNAAGQTAPSYLAAADCGVVEPTDTAALGFPNMHIVMNVTGDTTVGPSGCDAPADVPWLSVTPTGGTTNGGSSSNVTVGFDSTGLSDGTYNAMLCVNSNDPQTPLVEVPVSLTVLTSRCPVGSQEVTLVDEDFAGSFPPAGWAIANSTIGCTGIPDWTNTDPGARTNLTGGSGLFAIADSDDCGSGVSMNAQMWTPALNLTGLTDPMIEFKYDYNDIGTTDSGALDVSTDGGATWTNEYTWTVDDRGPRTYSNAIIGAGDNDVVVRWHYVASWDWWWEVDDVVITACEGAQVPNIDVDPLSMASTQAPNTTTQQTLDVGNTGGEDLSWTIAEEPTAAPELADWSDNFDSYATGSQLHGQGGWKGWFNDPAAGALTSGAQFRSSPNSAAILGASDLVHEYAETDGQWVYTAWQYIPTDYTGGTVFILLNSYDDAGANLNWSTQVRFNGGTNQVVNDGGASGGTLPLVKGQWVEIRVEIDLDADTQSFYYNNQLLYSGTWSGEVSGGGATSIAAVDLFADGAPVVYYDDMSLVNVSEPTVCSALADIPWASVSPANGVTLPGDTTPVDVTFDSTGLTAGVYTGNLCVDSDDPDPGPGNGTDLVVVPLELTVTEPQNASIVITKTVGTEPGVCATSSSITVPAGTTVYYCYTVANTGDVTLNYHTLMDDQLGTIFANFNYALTPGSSVNTVAAGVTASAAINAPTTNVATWTAVQALTGGQSATATSTAFVDVIYFSCENPEEDFESAPLGWTMVNNAGGASWGSIAACGPNGSGGNFTGGLGDAACMSPSSLDEGAYDAEMRTPVFSLVGYSEATISYLANYQNWGGIDRLNLDISADGGATWTTLRSWNSDQGAFQNTPGVFPTVDLAAYLGQSNLMLRWHYFWNNPQALGWYAQIDEAEFKCVEVPPTAVTLDGLNATPAAAAGSLSLLALPAVISMALGAAYVLRRKE